MKREDIAKVVLVFVVGLTLAFDLCYYHPAPATEVKRIKAPFSETNLVFHLPLARIGSGIR
tara:strand:+ start:217 stop:399 length:183 start_codon:yes stop_codon:yes gene_type:complete